MSDSKDGMELCTLLVQEAYGELASRIFNILLRRGRLPIRVIAQQSGLKVYHLRHGLAVLMMQNLLYYYQDGPTTFYEARDDIAYRLTRSGRIMEFVESRHGPIARRIIKNVLDLGHGKVSEIFEACDTQDALMNGIFNGNGTNGNGHVPRAKPLDATLKHLLQAGLVQPYIRNSLRNARDMHNQFEKELLKTATYRDMKGPRAKIELQEEVRQKMEAFFRPHVDLGFNVGVKRSQGPFSNDFNGNGKRRKLSNDDYAVNGHDMSEEDREIEIDRDLHIQVNFEKFDVIFRNDMLVDLAEQRLGPTTSQVFAHLLDLMQKRIARCHKDPFIDEMHKIDDELTIRIEDLYQSLKPSLDFSQGITKVKSEKLVDKRFLEKLLAKRDRIQEEEENALAKAAAPADPSVIISGHAAPQTQRMEQNEQDPDDEEEDETMDDEDDDDVNEDGNIPEVIEDANMDGADDPFLGKSSHKRSKVTFSKDIPQTEEDHAARLEQLNYHLTLLAADEYCFARPYGEEQWTVDFAPLVERLRDTEIDSIIMHTFGKGAHRLVRMMRKEGKLDEKLLPNTSLLSPKEIRTQLAKMQMAGYVDVQGIPRDAAHSVNRSIFLWYFDHERVAAIVLKKLYKLMARHISRLDVERARHDEILSLAERTDIQDGTEKLSEEHLEALNKFRDIEDRLMGKMKQCDMLVGIFRDF